MYAPPATIAPEIIACITEGRLPTLRELRRVAERMRGELRGARDRFRSVPERIERRLMLRAALAALAGTGAARRIPLAA